MITRYDDVTSLLRSDLSVEDRNLDDGFVAAQYDQLTGDSSVLAMSMLDRDPPDHTRLRRLVTQVLTPRAVAALEPMVTAHVDEALDRVANARRADLVKELTHPLPAAVISTMLGMPPTDHVRLRELTGILVLASEVVPEPGVLDAIVAAETEASAMIREVIAWKRDKPGNDILTALIAARHDGDQLTDDELVAQTLLLYVGGHETTVNLLGNGAIALLRNPDQCELLRARPELIGNAVEEFLRYDSPIQQTRRITTAPVSVGGREIPPGAYVKLVLASANRDPGFWGEQVDEVRIDRANARRHVSFGGGQRHCLGAALARLEGRVALWRLVSRFPRLKLDGNVTWNGRTNFRGAARIPVVF
ncbi:cytochrome P450 [Streptomyces scopuliridis]|uniref:cytochrome P450 n=1 Tax=Streptomyces scopuliridis TaxID=452529 RepID=UPI003440CC6E